MRYRPLGVTLCGALCFLSGGALVLPALARLNADVTIATSFKLFLGPLLVSLFFLAIGIGLIMLQPWSRWLLFVGGGLVMLLLTTQLSVVGLGVYGLALATYGWIFWYFLQPGVKAQFVKGTPTHS